MGDSQQQSQQDLQQQPQGQTEEESSFDITDLDGLIEKIQTDQTTMIIAIVVCFVVVLIVALICVALCSFLCGTESDGPPAQDLESNGQLSPRQGPVLTKSFVIQEEKDRIVQDIRRRLRTQLYAMPESDSPLMTLGRNSNAGLIGPGDQSFSNGAQGQCSLCKNPFRVGESTFITSCKHSFHQQCLFDWICEDVERKLKVEHEKTMMGQEANLAACGAQCPISGKDLWKQELVEEQVAIEELGNVLGLLSQSQVDLYTIREEDAFKSSRLGPGGVGAGSNISGVEPFGKSSQVAIEQNQDQYATARQEQNATTRQQQDQFTTARQEQIPTGRQEA